MRRLIVIGTYLVLLLASTLVRRAMPPSGPLAPDQFMVRIPETVGGVRTGRQIDMACLDIGARSDAPGLPVVVLHGSPVATPAMRPLIAELTGPRRIIAPDLPGFHPSMREVADYSFVAHAHAVVDLLDQLGLERVHLAAYSMGGGVAIEMAALAPQRVASITMISGLGVQELELLGDHDLNHTVHSLQFVAIRALQAFTPHFGFLDRFPINVAYARNFLDSDQRPLRGMLEKWSGPMLIVHGSDDILVPPAAASEHARIVPQSTLVRIPGGHIIVITDPAVVVVPVNAFLRDVESGRARTRATADPARIAAAAEPFDWRRLGARGRDYEIGAALLLGAATLGSEDLACISGGLMVSRGALGFGLATLGCFGGIVIGDVLLFLAGRWLGAPALRRRPMRWFLKADRVERCSRLFERKGAMLVLLARFLPGLRLPTYFAAGATGMRIGRFLLYFLGAALVWTPILVGAAAIVGDPILAWAAHAGHVGWLVTLGGLAALWIGARVGALALTWRGRRLLLGWWRRRTRWEFWPSWMIYPPVAAYALWLGLRHRGLNVVTAANPAIPGGGFAGESKAAILRGFAGDDAIARFALVDVHAFDPYERLAALVAFMTRENLAFPIVLKPDVGERGQGVAIVRDRTAAAAYLARSREPVIAQEYVGGREFGLFYARHPGEPRGRIISVTAKHLTSVRGDGTRSLEELILTDERAVCSAPFFLEKLSSRLSETPADGAEIRLTELGTHCRGARFTDGRDEAWSELLEERLDALAKRNAGFFFGRFDVRTPSADALREEAGFLVLEVNGVTSESTHIYDPRFSLLEAWRILCAQWRLAFEIGAANRARGFPPARSIEVMRAILTHLGREKLEV